MMNRELKKLREMNDKDLKAQLENAEFIIAHAKGQINIGNALAEEHKALMNAKKTRARILTIQKERKT